MSISPNNPTWRALCTALDELREECGCVYGAIVDAGNAVWCVSYCRNYNRSLHEANAVADRFLDVEVLPQAKAIRRGARSLIMRDDDYGHYLAKSFATIYFVVVFFDGPFSPTLVAAQVKRALPRIEALTLALPPPDGPNVTTGAKRSRA